MKRPESSPLRTAGSFLAVAGLAVVVATGIGWLRGTGGRSPEPVAVAGSPHCLDGMPELDISVREHWRMSWERLSEEDCHPGSWIYQFREPGQNFADYRVEAGDHLPRSRSMAVRRLTPFRDSQALELMSPTTEFLAIFFQREVDELPPVPLPFSAGRRAGGQGDQRDAQEVVSALVGSCPKERAGCLALTDQDLYAEDLEYVFGLGHFRERVGVMSTHRLSEPTAGVEPGSFREATEVDVLRRALKIATHEMSHQLGVAHCVHYRDCLVAGTNSLDASDRSQLRLCPLDHTKLSWRLGFDTRRRFSELAAFGRRHGLHREAAYWERMAEQAPALPNAAGGGAP